MKRRYLVPGLAAAALAGYALYTLWWEPSLRLRVVRWRVFRPEWQGRDPVRIVAISDLHAGAPHISLDRISMIVARANALAPDVAVILGDLAVAHPFTWGGTCKADIAGRLAAFKGRKGRFAVLGHQGWWKSSGMYLDHCGPVAAGDALEDVGFTVLDNQAALIGGEEHGFWLAGLGEPHRRLADRGHDRLGDLTRAVDDVGDDAPIILLAHEPDVFASLDHLHHSVPLQISVHSYGGRLRSREAGPTALDSDNENYSWGRYDENGRTLIVSGGIGCSQWPMRQGCQPEITVIEIAPTNHF